jgi:hypothetical protein
MLPQRKTMNDHCKWTGGRAEALPLHIMRENCQCLGACMCAVPKCSSIRGFSVRCKGRIVSGIVVAAAANHAANGVEAAHLWHPRVRENA